MNHQANEKVRLRLEQLVGNGEELGLQVAAYHRGRLVIDAWAGLAETATRRKVDGDTLFTVFSTTKGILYGAIHLLAERGKLGYDKRVARYWPAFAANGKAGITVAQVLDHSAGVPQMPDGLTVEDLCSWNRMCAALAELHPLWEPGSRTGYHGYSNGWILGEVLRRIDGRPVPQFVREEICGPLGLKSLFLGIPDSVEARVALLVDAPPPDPARAFPPLMERAIPPYLPAAAVLFNRPEVRRACIPAAGGIMNARDLARYYASLTPSGADGIHLLSAPRVALATRERRRDLDQCIGLEIRKGLGWFLPGPNAEGIPDSTGAFGHPGAGGSVGYADPARDLAVGFAKTLLVSTADLSAATDVKVTRTILEALGIT
jgi:CubicO group peptidase (beta-lactamase class C family)